MYWCHSLGIGTAFAVLSDPEKKARYDEYGETLEPARIGRRQYNDFEREFEGWWLAILSESYLSIFLLAVIRYLFVKTYRRKKIRNLGGDLLNIMFLAKDPFEWDV